MDLFSLIYFALPLYFFSLSTYEKAQIGQIPIMFSEATF